MTKPIVQYLRSQGVRVVFYLDDVLLLAQTRRGAQENRRRTVHLLGKLGFSLNHEKSDFVPRQSFSYLGLQWDTRSMQVRLPEDKVAEMATDASSSGWGGSLHALSANGRWSRGQRSRHINSLELMAVENSLRPFQDRVEGRTVCVQIDNRTAVAYLAKEGGTKSVLLSRLACRILLWCQRHRITLIPVYVRGISNTIADALSRGKETQWHLSPMMADRIFQRYGTPQVDLFASRETAQLPQYMPLQRGDYQALAMDALSQTWDFDLVYAFPPPTLVPTVANKLRGSKTRMLLVAPCWCDAPWMPVLTELLFDTPRRIPVSPRLLINTSTNYPVGNVEALRLTVWPICGQPQASTSHLLPSRFWGTAGDPVPGGMVKVLSKRVYGPDFYMCREHVGLSSVPL